jgi:hypothetical protein
MEVDRHRSSLVDDRAGRFSRTDAITESAQMIASKWDFFFFVYGIPILLATFAPTKMSGLDHFFGPTA